MKRSRRNSEWIGLQALLLAVLIVSSCSDRPEVGAGGGEQGDEDLLSVQIRFVEQEDRTESDAAPGAFWDMSVRYPQIAEGVPEEIARSVNTAIEQAVSSSACEGPGDQHFSAEVTRNDAYVLSLKYEAMWMCSSMPHPDSTSAGLTFDLRTGDMIRLETELSKDPQRQRELQRRIADAARIAISKNLGDGASDCPDPGMAQEFFLAGRAAVFTELFQHADSACEVEVTIPLDELRPYLEEGSILSRTW